MKNKFGAKLIAPLILCGLNAVAGNMVQDGNFAADTSVNNPVLNGPLNPSPSPWTVTSSAGTTYGVSMVVLPNGSLAPKDPLTVGSPDLGLGQAPYYVDDTTTQTLSQVVSGFVAGTIYEVSFDAYLAYSGAHNTGTPSFSVLLGPNNVANFPLTSLPAPSSPSDASAWTHVSNVFTAPSSGSLTLDFIFIANLVPSKDILVDRIYIGPPVSPSNCFELLCPTNILVDTCSNCAAVNFAATVLDSCCSNSNVQISYGIGGAPIDTNYCFPLGTNIVQVTASDGCSNTASCSFTVTVLPGNGCPTNCLQIQCPNDIVLTSCVPTQVFYSPIVTDLCCTNAEVLVAAGANINPPYNGYELSSSELYDLASGKWTATGSLSTSRAEYTATLLADGRVLAAGGASSYNSVFLSSVELYHPATRTWSATGSMTTPRFRHMATLLPNGKLLIAGGSDGSTYLSSAELYDPATGLWTATGSMSIPRFLATTTLLPNGKVLAAGGVGNTSSTATAELYDPVTGMWTATGSTTAQFFGGNTATLLANGKVLFAGGYGPAPADALSNAELYDPTAGTWTATGPMITPRTRFTATLLPNGKVLVAGGENSSPGLAAAELYDPATGTWASTAPMTTARWTHTATLLPNGQVLVVGGVNGGTLATAELYDPATATWKATGSMITAREEHTAGLLPKWTVVCNPPSGTSFVPGTTNTVTCVGTDNCGNSNSCTFTVAVISCANTSGPCCGPGLGPQTINWLPFPTNGTVLSDPLGTNPQGSWWLTNLPCYGRVLVTQNFPDLVYWFLNTNLVNVPNGYGTFNFTDPGYGPYSWGTAAFMDFFATNQHSYSVTFYFLDGQPNPCNLVLGVAGLAETTTAKASQSLTFRTEYDLNSPLSGSTFSAETRLDTFYGLPIAGSTGTLVGSAYAQTGSSGDPLNTGWAVLQPANSLATTNLAAGSVQGFGGPLNNLPYLSLDVTQQAGDGIGFTVGYICCSNCLQVEAPSDILVDSCTNVTVDYPGPVVTDPCCTNWSVVFNPPSGTSFASGQASLVNWSVYDCSGTNVAASGTFWVSVVCSNCCPPPLTNYTVTVVQGSNYLADCLCQGTNNSLAHVLPSVPLGTQVYFWNSAAGTFNPPDTFTGNGWQDGTEPMYPGEGFLLVSFTNQYQLTIYGNQPTCNGGCTPLNCSSDTLLIGDYGITPNPVPICNLICCPPFPGTEVQVWNATSQSFSTYTYGGTWSPSTPPPLPVGYSDFISVDKSLPVIICPGPIVTNSCTNVAVFFSVTASNAFGGTLNATVNPPSGSHFKVGTTNVSCTVTNACGGVANCSFTVTVNCPTNSVIQISQSGGTVSFNWASGQNWHLQFRTNLNSANWGTVTGALDGSYTTTVNKAGPSLFYRLKRP